MTFAVDVRNLVKVYDNSRVLDGVDLQIDNGKVFALLGPNGAGKTTLMRILTTQIESTSGEAYIFGLNVAHKGSEVRRLISYVPQEMSVWTDISGYENLLIYSKIYGTASQERRDAIEKALQSMELGNVQNNLVKTYSGGMIRRLEIACAMLIRPKILFLDEPTIGLDPSARRIVWERLTSFKKEQGMTVFFNTHYMDEADHYSDEIAIINRGKIVKRGTASELKHSVGGELVELTLHDKTVKEDIMTAIRKLDFVSDVVADDGQLTIFARDAETALPQVIDIVKVHGGSIEKTSFTKPTLDDVFLSYAGTRLESEGRISDVTQVRKMIRRGG